jgi:hypothetical protein
MLRIELLLLAVRALAAENVLAAVDAVAVRIAMGACNTGGAMMLWIDEELGAVTFVVFFMGVVLANGFDGVVVPFTFALVLDAVVFRFFLLAGALSVEVVRLGRFLLAGVLAAEIVRLGVTVLEATVLAREGEEKDGRTFPPTLENRCRSGFSGVTGRILRRNFEGTLRGRRVSSLKGKSGCCAN